MLTQQTGNKLVHDLLKEAKINGQVLHLPYEKSLAGSHTTYQNRLRQCPCAPQGIKT
jgi:hypothetical protein